MCAILSQKADDKNTTVVAVGASAGGLEAMQDFFGNLSENTGLAYVVIQHLSPDYKSLLGDILAKSTRIPITEAEDGMKVEPDRVYLLPPKKNMTIRDRTLFLSDQDHALLNHPIDLFFTSLAEDARESAIAVVLSGTGTDGTGGVKAVKEQGGLIIVQDPSSAQFDGMPKSALNTGLCDLILPPADIARELSAHISNAINEVPVTVLTYLRDETALTKIFAILKHVTGIDYSQYKKNTILRRIERRMIVMHMLSIEAYTELLSSNAEEVKTLGREILIGVTKFFRDSEYFEELKKEVITPLIKNSEENQSIRVWDAGCSTGEESYSVAIFFSEVMEELGMTRDVKIFATDLDVEAVERAGKGFYDDTIISDVSADRINQFFIRRNGGFAITKDLRRMLIFAPHNIFQDPAFGRVDLIVCRNVIIYFNSDLQKSIFSIFHSALNKGGYLFLGKSETVNGISSVNDVFKPLVSHAKIYRHESTGPMPQVPQINYPIVSSLARHYNLNFGADHATDEAKNTEQALYLKMMEDFFPPCAVINKRNDVLHTFGAYEPYLSVPKGKMTDNLFEMLVEPLKLPVSTAVNRVRDDCKPLTYSNVVINGAGDTLAISVLPLAELPDQENNLLAVMFGAVRTDAIAAHIEPYDVNEIAAQRIIHLESELLASHDRLRSTVGELETANEELQAANEEMLTANEELQSSNEELQSVNEELYTVNAEYQTKLEELNESNDDLSNFLSSTMIGIIFIDREFRIRRFTDYAAKEFNMIESDIGRPFFHVTHNFVNVDFAEEINTVLRTLVPIEREYENKNGKKYVVRVSPYRTVENTIKGLVLSIIDIQDLRSESYAQIRRLSFAIEQMSNLVLIANSDRIIEYCNPAFLEKMEYEISEVIGQSLDVFRPSQLSEAEFLAVCNDLKESSNAWRGEVESRKRTGELFWERITLTSIKDQDDEVTSFLRISEDITNAKDVLTGLPNRSMFKARVVQAMEDAKREDGQFAILFMDVDQFKYINDSFGHAVGDAVIKAVGQRLSDLLRPIDYLARFGGDEFLILLSDLDNYDQAADMAQNIVQTFGKKIKIGKQKLAVSCSIGIIIYPHDADTYEELIKGSDSTMYTAKEAGRNTYRFFSNDYNSRLLENLTLLRDLPDAINSGEILPYYQPIVDVRTGRIVAFEALARWHKSRAKMIMPDAFIPLAESSGTILPLTRSILRSAANQIKFWASLIENVRVSVNISFKLFSQIDVRAMVLEILEEVECPPHLIMLEITEGLAMNAGQKDIEQLQALKDAGIKISLDDFGMGFSSLSVLPKLPLDYIKVDRSFVINARTSPDYYSILDATLYLARKLHLGTVMEGVEDSGDMEMIKPLDVQLIQGYVISRPVSANDATKMLVETKGVIAGLNA